MYDHITIALTRKYNTFSQLTLKRIMFYGEQHSVELRLEEDEPLAVNKHPKNALPPLIKPGRKFRLLALTSKGEQYIIQREAVERHAQLPYLPLIGVRDDWAFVLSGSEPDRLLIARNLATSQCISFALPENATVTAMSDLICWPDPLKVGVNSFFLVRCSDGHWRGQRGKPNLARYEHFSDEFIDVDLSSLGEVVPLGYYANHRGEPPYPAYRVCFWSPEERRLNYCGFTLAGRVDIEPLSMSFGELWPSREGELCIALYKASPICWQTDEKGYVTNLWLSYPVERPHLVIERQSYAVADLLEQARCLSD